MSHSSIIALIDVNNFYVSCERIFQPSLNQHPVIVLSNNDGCAISRSQEAKDLGIKMGEPYFKFKNLVKKHNIKVLSSNYTLYADMSARVMKLLAKFSPNQEIYSIDECFLNLTGFKKRNDMISYANEIKKSIKLCLGLPVCVGIGPTKTLAKLANHMAKKHENFNGICDFNSMPKDLQNIWMEHIDVSEVWGIGRNLSLKLHKMNINSVMDLKKSNFKRMREQFSVVMERTIEELNGYPALELEEFFTPRKQIISSKSFGKSMTCLSSLQEALSTYIKNAWKKLREQNSLLQTITVYIKTNRFSINTKQHRQSIQMNLTSPTDDIIIINKIALFLLGKIYRTGYKYHKVGIMLSSLSQKNENEQYDFFINRNSKNSKVNDVYEQINKKWTDKIQLASAAGIKKEWKMKSENKSRNYTTNWNELCKAFAN